MSYFSTQRNLSDIAAAINQELDQEKRKSLVELYEAAKDENELLEFKNYELQFKIQELEQNQKRILTKLVNVYGNSSSNSNNQQFGQTNSTKTQQTPTTNLPAREALLSVAAAANGNVALDTRAATATDTKSEQPGKKSAHDAPIVGELATNNATEAQINGSELSFSRQEEGGRLHIGTGVKLALADQHIGARSALGGHSASDEFTCATARASAPQRPLPQQQPVDSYYCPRLGHLEHEHCAATATGASKQTAMEFKKELEFEGKTNNELAGGESFLLRGIFESHDPVMFDGSSLDHNQQQVAGAITKSEFGASARSGATNSSDFVSNSMDVSLEVNGESFDSSEVASLSYSLPLTTNLTSPLLESHMTSRDDLPENEHLIEYNGTDRNWKTSGSGVGSSNSNSSSGSSISRSFEEKLEPASEAIVVAQHQHDQHLPLQSQVKPGMLAQQVGGAARAVGSRGGIGNSNGNSSGSDGKDGHDFPPTTWQNYDASQSFPSSGNYDDRHSGDGGGGQSASRSEESGGSVISHQDERFVTSQLGTLSLPQIQVTNDESITSANKLDMAPKPEVGRLSQMTSLRNNNNNNNKIRTLDVKSLAKSQPNLSSPVNQHHQMTVRNKPLTSGARIAVPVSARSVSSGQQMQKQQQPQPQQQQQRLSSQNKTPTLRGPMSYLHTRSKSSLDRTNTRIAPHRVGNSSTNPNKPQQVVDQSGVKRHPVVAVPRLSRATSSLARSNLHISKSSHSLACGGQTNSASATGTRLTNSGSHLHLAITGSGVAAATTTAPRTTSLVSSPRIPILSNNLPLKRDQDKSGAGAKSTTPTAFNRLSRSKSSTSLLGFVTQIPTLISNSHASKQAATVELPLATDDSFSSSLSKANKVALTCPASAAPQVAARCSTSRLSGSKSMLNLEAPIVSKQLVGSSDVSGQEIRVADKSTTQTTNEQSKGPGQDSKVTLIAASNDNDEVEAGITSGHQQPLSGAQSMGDSSGSEPAARTLAASQWKSQSLSCVASGAGSDAKTTTGRCIANKDHRQDQSGIIESMPLPNDQRSITLPSTEPLPSLSSPVVSPGRGANEPLEQAPGKTQSALSLLATSPTDTAKQHQQQQPTACQQCKLFQSKLNVLIRERKQLNEQLSEMDEMENDSRLMSQKLAQQLNLVQLQLDACRMELDRSCSSESKLQFQNKRLHLELNQRLELIQHLQSRLNKLKTVGAPVECIELLQESSEVESGKHSSSRNIDELQSTRSEGLTSQFEGLAKNERNEKIETDDIMAAAGHQSDKPTPTNAATVTAAAATTATAMEATKDIDNDNNNNSGCDPARIVASARSSHRSPAESLSSGSNSGSGSGDDGDSAIDIASAQASHIATGGSETGQAAASKLRPINGAAVSPSSSSSSGKSDKLLHDCNDNNASGVKDAAARSGSSQINEDSAYSKSSASSDGFNSDDGGSCCSSNSSGDASGRGNKGLVGGRRSTSDRSGCHAQTETEVGKVDELGAVVVKSPTSSSSSSCDESDHHEQQLGDCVGSNVNNNATILPPPTSNQGNGGTNGPALTTSIQLSGRQQVMRKRISTARILRGAQVMNSTVINNGGLPRPIEQQQQQQQDGEQMSSLSLISQARYAHVVASQAANSLSDCNKSLGCVEATKSHNQQVETGRMVKSPIERVLEGVNDLESGKVVDEALRSLASLDEGVNCASTTLAQSQQVVVAAAMTTTTTVPTCGESQTTPKPIGYQHHQSQPFKAVGRQPINWQYEQQQQQLMSDKNLKATCNEKTTTTATTAMQEKLIGQFKQEIANLKMRLLQANTLNDNLVAELRNSKEHRHHHQQQPMQQVLPRQYHHQQQQQQQQASQSKVMLTFSSSATGCPNNGHSSGSANNNASAHNQQQFYHQHQRAAPTTATAANPTREQHQMNQKRCSSSVIYVNGLPVAPLASHSSGLTLASATNRDHHNLQLQQQQQQQQQVHHNHHQCVSVEELIDFFHFLLDKLHFHHGRTFKLVNECQKLTMSALLAGYSHQMNLIHHNSVVMAGNQLLQTRHQQQQVDLGSQQGEPVAQTYPIRPPPRRRNAANRMLGIDQQPISSHPQQADNYLASQSSAISHQDKTQQAPPPVSVTASATSALQAAKQTLFSLVPIYYTSNNNNNNNHSAKNQNGKNQQAVLEASPQEPQQLQASHHNQPPPNMPQFACTVPAQHLAKVKSSLSEEIERHRVYFNGQLLDLLTRQNWCESLVAEKLKVYKIKQRQPRVAANSDSYC